MLEKTTLQTCRTLRGEMNIKRPFEVLDEKIYRLHENIYHKAYTSLGWSKFDLARKAQGVGSAGLAGQGVYCTIEGIIGSAAALIIIGSAVTIFSIYNHKTIKKNYDREEKSEIELLEQGYVPKPSINPLRSFMTTLSGVLASYGIYILTAPSYPIPDDFSGSSPEINTLKGLGLIAASISILGHISALYFRDQIMQPPKKKQTIWRKALDYVSKPFRSKPVLEPQEQPAKSLENLVSD